MGETPKRCFNCKQDEAMSRAWSPFCDDCLRMLLIALAAGSFSTESLRKLLELLAGIG